MMKKKYLNFRWITLVIACLTCFHAALAYDTYVDGIYYDVTEYSDGSAVALVAHNGSDNTYSGFVNIPTTINYNDKEVPVTGVGYRAFKNSTGLTGVSIPEGAIMLLNEAFAGCTGLTAITLPSTMSSIYNNAFIGCTGLTDVICLRPTASSANANNFDAATYATATLHVPMGSSGSYSTTPPWSQFTHIVEDGKFAVDGIYYNIENGNSVSVTYKDSNFNTYSGYLEIPSSVTYNGVTYDVVAVGDDAFRGCSELNELVIPNSVISIGNRAFYDCDQIEVISLGTGVTWIGSQAFKTSSFFYLMCFAPVPPTIQSDTFYGNVCQNSYLFVSYPVVDAYVAAPYWDTFGAGRIFGYCDFMEGENYYCITGPNTVGVCAMALSSDNSAFFPRYDYTVVTEIDIPATVTHEGVTYQVTSIDAFAFAYCDKLKKVYLHEGLTGFGANAFYGCSSLDDIVFPQSLTMIGYGAFMRCKSLKKVVIPDKVNAIDYGAFYLCDSIEHIIIGSGLEYVGYRAFYMSNNLLDVTCNAVVPPATDPDVPVFSLARTINMPSYMFRTHR